MLITFDWALLEPNGVHFWRLCFLKFQNLKSDFWPKHYFEVSVPKIWFLENFNSIKKIKKSGGISQNIFRNLKFLWQKSEQKFGGIPIFFLKYGFFWPKFWKKYGGTPKYFSISGIFWQKSEKNQGVPKIFFEIWSFLTKIWTKSGGEKVVAKSPPPHPHIVGSEYPLILVQKHGVIKIILISFGD